MNYYCLRALKYLQVGFGVEQSARLALPGAVKLIRSVSRKSIVRKDYSQLLAATQHRGGHMANNAARSDNCSLMNGKDYRDSLRKYKPTVYVDGRLIESVVDAPSLQPGINAIAVTYDFALDPARAPLMTARQSISGRTVNRMLHINESAGDLLNKLEAVRILCQETGCAQCYLAHDALNGIGQAVARIDDAKGSTEYRAKFAAYLQHVQDDDLALGIAMTDAKGDRSKRPNCSQPGQAVMVPLPISPAADA